MAIARLDYISRPAFLPLHNRAQRWGCVVCHRRSGKTFSLVHDLLIGALETTKRRPQFAFLSPTYSQAKRNAWEYLKDAARPFLKMTPNETELRVDLKNDSRIFLAGSDNADSLRGIYLDGAVMDEYALQHPSVWTQIIRPALADREGWAVLAGTPKGKNHLYDAYQAARVNKEWFTMLLPASTSGIIKPDELRRMKEEMPEDEYLQEMECDWTATSKGAILFREIEQADREGRITTLELYEPRSKVIAVSDIGFRDTAAWWFVQKRNDGAALIDYDEASGLDASDWLTRLRGKPYPVDEVWLPHDAKNRTFATRNSPFETFLSSGLAVRIVPKTSILDRVNAARVVARRCYWQAQRCAKGLHHLREWTYEWIPELKVFSRTPLHNSASHGSDAFSYMAQMMGNHFQDLRPVTLPTPEAVEAVGLHYAFSLDQLHDDRGKFKERF